MVAGQRLKEARKKANLTQVELANIIGVKAAEISQYESNKRTPRWPAFNKLLDALNITAQGLETIQRKGSDKIVLKRLDEILERYNNEVETIVVGMPLHMNGDISERAKATR